MDDIQDLYSIYREAERAWIQSITTTTPASGASGSIEDCSLHYGEIGFLLAGLKPCVLIQLPTPELTHSLYSQSNLIQRAIDMFFPSAEGGDDNGRIIPEQDMAVILDIPGRLPENELEVRRMVEVSYWHQVEALPDIQPVLLTAFAAQPDQMHSIQAHFKRYKYNVQRQFGVLLKLHVQSMADIA
ncbi:hypothetical protein BGX31_001631 [Mortierella sp. GBA43]|nr:hypothetical protein BGX31_001631 [Mortierella sp. GBA43]